MSEESRPVLFDSEQTLVPHFSASLPLFSTDEMNGTYTDIESRLTNEEQDALLRVRIHSMPRISVSMQSRTQPAASLLGLLVSFTELFSC